MAKSNGLGNQELEIFKWVARREPISVKEASKYFEKNMGLARTTVLTVMERLRKKGYLERKKMDGIFHYRSKKPTENVLTDAIGEFISSKLGGSVSPLLQYFSTAKLSDEERRTLSALVKKLSKEEKK